MYTRNYIEDDGSVNIPQNYDGIAFDTEIPEMKNTVSATVGEKKVSPKDYTPPQPEPEEAPASANVDTGGGIFGNLFGKFQLKNLFSGSMHSVLGLDRFKLGAEELLLIGLALFLLFSKEGDKECAIILLLLLFVN